MTKCNGRLFDGSACNNAMIDCADCGLSGCVGDGCDNQRFAAQSCDCGALLPDPVAGISAAA